jgi:hypothetical protein
MASFCSVRGICRLFCVGTIVFTPSPLVLAEVCKGISRLVANETLDNEYNMGAGWYGNDEVSKGQFGPDPDAFYASDYEVRGGACVPSVSTAVQCHQSKGKANCNEAHTCSELLSLKQKLLGGGYNCFGRHERTYWHQYFGESGCKKTASCVADGTGVPGTGQPDGNFATTSRYLAPWGYWASHVAASAFANLGLKDNGHTFAASPFARCSHQAALFAGGDISDLSALDTTTGEMLMYTGSLRENVQRKGFCTNHTTDAEISSEASYKFVFDQMRQMAGTVPPEGKNNWYVTHGFNMKGAFGEQVDEG